MTTTGEHWNEWQLLEGFPLWSPDVAANYESRANVLGINAWECAILQSIWYDYGQVRSKDLLADRAFGVSGTKYPSKATAAIERCFSDGFIQFLTADFLSELKTELDAGGYLQPGGLIGTFFQDEVGLISFTRQGAGLYQKWIEFDPDTSEHFTIGPEVGSWCEVYGTSEEWCRHAPPSDRDEYVLEGPTVEIGRWCDCWWNRFESGVLLRYRITNPTDMPPK
jgi:hypothetical protein